MSLSRFFVTADAIRGGCIEITEKGDLRHMAKVLRLKTGDRIQVSDSEAYEYEAEILEISPELALCRIHDKQRFTSEPRLQTTLFQSIPKQGKMETIIQKTVELGICRIVPVFTARTVVEDKGKMKSRRDRWQKVAAEAVKQCGRGVVPEVAEALTFNEMKEALTAQSFDLILFLYEDEAKTTIKDVLRGRTGIERAALIIGPEGGFSPEEAAALKELAHSASLGKTILRTETAGMAALAMVMYELEL